MFNCHHSNAHAHAHLLCLLIFEEISLFHRTQHLEMKTLCGQVRISYVGGGARTGRWVSVDAKLDLGLPFLPASAAWSSTCPASGSTAWHIRMESCTRVQVRGRCGALY